MSILPRCGLAGQANSASVAVPLTGWINSGAGVSGTAPVVGDLLIACMTTNGNADLMYQTAGTQWSIFDPGTANGTGLTSAVFYKWWEGTETAPTFASTNGSRYAITLVALAPDAGYILFPDVWATIKQDTTAATTHTPNSAAVTSPYSDMSLLIAGAASGATGTSAITATAPTNWTSLPVASNTGASTVSYGALFAYRSAQTGTVAPGAWTIEGGSSATGTTTANTYQMLIRELQISSTPLQIVQTASVGAANSCSFANPTTLGNSIIAIIPLSNSAATAPAVSAVTAGSDNFIAAVQNSVVGSSIAYYAGIWLDSGCSPQSTVSFAGTNYVTSSTADGLVIIEVQGKLAVDKTVSAVSSGTSAAASSGATATTTQANELWTGAVSGGAGNKLSSGPAAGGNVFRSTDKQMEGGAYAIATATGTATMGATLKSASSWVAVAATFMPVPYRAPATYSRTALMRAAHY